MALVYSKTYQHGGRKQLGPGYHYKKKCRSIVVPEGQVVTLYEKQDRTGWKSLPLYEGEYHSLGFYGLKNDPGLVLVEKTELTHLDMIEIGWEASYGGGKGKYRMHYSVPVGDRKYGEDFPNDKIQWLRIPFGLTVEVFDKGDFSGGSLVFSGNIQGKSEIVWLGEYNYSWKISSMKVRSDEWVSAGIAIEEEAISNSERTIATTELSNNSPHLASISKEISAEYTEETTEDWNIEAGVTAKVGFEAGTETVKATGELEVSISGGYGESKTTGVERSITDIATVEVDGYGTAKASLIIEEGRMEGIAVRKWRNKRNNVIIEQRGKISCNRANKARVEVNG